MEYLTFFLIEILSILSVSVNSSSAAAYTQQKTNQTGFFCKQAFACKHNSKEKCGLQPETREVRRFIDACDMLEFNCEYNTVMLLLGLVAAHGPPKDRDSEDIAMGRKVKKISAGKLQMGSKWCSSAKVCNHDRVPVCGVSHAGEIMGFRDLCDMFDFNCIRRRNYKQISCPEDKSVLTASRRPTNVYSDY